MRTLIFGILLAVIVTGCAHQVPFEPSKPLKYHSLNYMPLVVQNDEFVEQTSLISAYKNTAEGRAALRSRQIKNALSTLLWMSVGAVILDPSYNTPAGFYYVYGASLLGQLVFQGVYNQDLKELSLLHNKRIKAAPAAYIPLIQKTF